MNYTLVDKIATYIEVQFYGGLISLVGSIGILLLLLLVVWYRSNKNSK